MSAESVRLVLPGVDLEGHKLTGVMPVFYTDPEAERARFDLALNVANLYQGEGRPLIVVDGSEKGIIDDQLRERGAIVVPAHERGIATQNQQGVATAFANGAEAALRHEEGKPTIMKFADKIIESLAHFDQLVIGRTEQAMKPPLPTFQAMTERKAGELLTRHLGLPEDALSGGRAYTRKGGEYLAQYDGPNNWLYLYYPMLAAMKAGEADKVGGIQVDLVHPQSMFNEEQGNRTFEEKRIMQYLVQLELLLPDMNHNPAVEEFQRHLSPVA